MNGDITSGVRFARMRCPVNVTVYGKSAWLCAVCVPTMYRIVYLCDDIMKIEVSTRFQPSVSELQAVQVLQILLY